MIPASLWSVLLTQVSRQLLTRDPSQRPPAGPGSCVSACVLDRDFIFQGVEVRPRETLHQSKLLGVRKTAVGEPEVLVEPPGVDLQHLAYPFSHRTAVIERVVVIAPDLARMTPAVEVDDTEIAGSPANQHENTLPFTVFDELDPVGQLQLAWPAGRFAI